MITTTTKGKGYRDNVCGGDKKKHVLRASRAKRERERERDASSLGRKRFG